VMIPPTASKTADRIQNDVIVDPTSQPELTLDLCGNGNQPIFRSVHDRVEGDEGRRQMQVRHGSTVSYSLVLSSCARLDKVLGRQLRDLARPAATSFFASRMTSAGMLSATFAELILSYCRKVCRRQDGEHQGALQASEGVRARQVA
jgi:hypothetical protein